MSVHLSFSPSSTSSGLWADIMTQRLILARVQKTFLNLNQFLALEKEEKITAAILHSCGKYSLTMCHHTQAFVPFSDHIIWILRHLSKSCNMRQKDTSRNNVDISTRVRKSRFCSAVVCCLSQVTTQCP